MAAGRLSDGALAAAIHEGVPRPAVDLKAENAQLRRKMASIQVASARRGVAAAQARSRHPTSTEDAARFDRLRREHAELQRAHARLSDQVRLAPSKRPGALPCPSRGRSGALQLVRATQVVAPLVSQAPLSVHRVVLDLHMQCAELGHTVHALAVDVHDALLTLGAEVERGRADNDLLRTAVDSLQAARAGARGRAAPWRGGGP